MVLGGSVEIQKLPFDVNTIVRPYGISSRMIYGIEAPKPETDKENTAIHLHPETMWYIFQPPKERIPYRKLYIPIDPKAPPRPPLPKWLKKDKRTGVPRVLEGVIGWLKITSWMLKIANEIIDNAVRKYEETGDRINHRKIRRAFRKRVSAVKRQQRWEKRQMLESLKDEPKVIDDFELDPREWGEGRFEKYKRMKEEKRAKQEREQRIAEEAAARIRPGGDPNAPAYKRGSGKFK